MRIVSRGAGSTNAVAHTLAATDRSAYLLFNLPYRIYRTRQLKPYSEIVWSWYARKF